jgi:hypothetical protein
MQRPPTSSQYELELVYEGVPESAVNATFPSPEQTLRWVKDRLQPNSVLTIAHMRDGADLGNFLIFNNDDGITHVRLLEHMGFYAKRTEAIIATGRTVAFTSDVGSMFSVDENSTVPLSAALGALAHWLATGTPDPQLVWGEE